MPASRLWCRGPTRPVVSLLPVGRHDSHRARINPQADYCVGIQQSERVFVDCATSDPYYRGECPGELSVRRSTLGEMIVTKQESITAWTSEPEREANVL